jgi:hypothetical protein
VSAITVCKQFEYYHYVYNKFMNHVARSSGTMLSEIPEQDRNYISLEPPKKKVKTASTQRYAKKCGKEVNH